MKKDFDHFQRTIITICKKYFLLILLIFLASCRKNLSEPTNFHSYQEVSRYLNEANFKIDEKADVPTSAWITSAHYQSKNREIGFLTLRMRDKPYYFQRVPLNLWNQFKNTDSKGSFYHKFIKGKYNISLNKNSTSQRCKGTTTKGKQCMRKAKKSGYCFQHR